MTTGKGHSSLSLGARIFWIMALVVALAIGAAVALTYLRGAAVAKQAVERSLASSQAMQTGALESDLEQLVLKAKVFAGDPVFVSYLAEAVGGGLVGEGTIDRASIGDQLMERKEVLKFDFDVTMLVDPDGNLLVRPDRPDMRMDNLSDQWFIRGVLTEFEEKTGYWREGGRLYQIAAVPIVQRLDFYGVLVVASAVGDKLADQTKRASGAELAFLVLASGKLEIPAASLQAAEREALLAALRAELPLVERVLQRGEEVREFPLAVGPFDTARLEPLKQEGSEGDVVGATVRLASIKNEMQSYRQILLALGLAGLGALLLALVSSFLLSRRLLRPVVGLTEAAERAAQGDYDTPVKVGSRDEVGRLGTAINSLLSDLRERRDMETYVQQLSRHLPEAPRTTASIERPDARETALVAVELRSFAQGRTVKHPAEAIDRLGRDLRRIQSIALMHRGRVDAVAGHRVLLSFDGDGGALRAVAAASEVRSALSVPESAFEDVEPPAVVVTTGQVASGSAGTEEVSGRAMLGRPIQLLEALLREASAGDVLLSRDAERAIRGTSTVELTETQGVLFPQPLYSLAEDQAARLVLPTAQTSLLTPIAPLREATISAPLGPGSVLANRFEIMAVLGAGGMGVVYKARDRELDDLVALKTLKRGIWEDTASLERMKSEIKLARKITHANVLRTFDFGEVDGLAYISMEYVRGMTVRYLLEQTGRLPYSAGVRLGRQLCAGLAAAHAEGVLHRDIKPENLILDQAGSLKLMDFGIARPLRETEGSLTAPGSVLGTPHYLAPEQLEGKAVDGRADLYAVGVVLYEMFTGERPFAGRTPAQIVAAHLTEQPTLPSIFWPEIPAALEALILKCLAKDPELRPASADQLLRELESLRA